MALWTRFYRTKQESRNRNSGRCEGCRKVANTHSHHLFIRRPDSYRLQNPINIVQLCPKCHYKETLEMQIRLSLKKLDEYGPEEIERWASSIPSKIPVRLPSHYWGARDIWEMTKGLKMEGDNV